MIADNLETDPAIAEALQRLPSLARHLARIRMPLSGMIDSYVTSTNLGRNWKLLEFFEFVKRTFSDAQYALIQKRHLSQQNLEFIHKSQFLSSELKYLDFPFWAHSKYSVGKKLELDKYAGESILDIGAGPGHFGLVVGFFGCRYEGLDIAHPPWTPHTQRHLYDDLCEFFRIERMMDPVRPFENLQVRRRYRMTTCLMGNFCSYDTKGGRRRPWGWPEWAFLLNNLASDVMTPAYSMYFQISRDYFPEAVLENIRKFAKTFDEERSVFTFDESLDLDALKRSARADP